MPEIKLKDGVSILAETIEKQIRHQDYDRVVEIATDYTIYSTGLGIGEKLKQFNMRETDEAFNQRKKLSQMNTPDIVNAVRKPLEKVPRTPANIYIAWKGKDLKSDQKQKKELLEESNDFWGNKSFEKYIAKRLPELDTTDPNTFIIIESKGSYDPQDPKSSKLKPYPFEANSKEAINYQYINNILQWLIVVNKSLMYDAKGLVSEGETYYLYLDNESVKAVQIHTEVVDGYMIENPDAQLLISTKSPDFSIVKPKKNYVFQIGEDKTKAKFFTLRAYEHKIGKVPAKRVGTITDTSTRNRTCVPVIHPAQCYFEKSIKTMSEFDLTNCLHVFPKLIQYADPCDGEIKGGRAIGCAKGLTPTGSVCKACNGSMFKVHTSTQDVLQIRMPKDISEIKSLEHILVYKSPPIDLLTFQQTFAFDKLREAAKNAVYNDTNIGVSSSTKTATEIDRNLDDTYDTLQAFADNFSDFYVWGYTCIASIRDLGKNIIIRHSFPSDFKFQSLSSLLDELEKANKNGAGSHVKNAINKKILQKIYIDQPKEILKLDTQNKFSPFPGKTDDEISFIIGSGLTSKYNSVLYANFGNIFSKIESESQDRNLDFYDMDYNMQKALINASVNDLMKEIEKDNSASTLDAFGSDVEIPLDIEAQARANLKGTVGGVNGILDIQSSVSEGKTERSAALKILETIYGFNTEEANAILGEPKEIKPLKVA